jgi:hypothetical protein
LIGGASILGGGERRRGSAPGNVRPHAAQRCAEWQPDIGPLLTLEESPNLLQRHRRP